MLDDKPDIGARKMITVTEEQENHEMTKNITMLRPTITRDANRICQ